MIVQAIGPAVPQARPPSSVLGRSMTDNHNVVRKGHSHHPHMASGYTENHAHFQEQKDHWARRASAAGNIKDVIAIKVFMGRIKPGQHCITIISVGV
jgi:hypothetical protein